MTLSAMDFKGIPKSASNKRDAAMFWERGAFGKMTRKGWGDQEARQLLQALDAYPRARSSKIHRQAVVYSFGP